MPIYEYRCGSCGHELEAMQKFSDPLLTQCPKCATDALVKLVSAAGFHLKGGGWYATDFKGGSKGGKKPDAGKSEGAKSEGAKSEGAKSEGGKSEGGEAGGKSEGEAAKPAGCGGGCACH